MKLKSTERDIQNAILEFMNLQRGFKVWRSNVGAVKREYHGKVRLIRFGRRGQADLTGIGPNGVRVEIEVKSEKSEATEDQALFLRDIRDAGGIAFVARSIEDCQEQLRLHGIRIVEV